MAVKATIKLQGGKALEKKLKELPKGIRNKVIRQSLRAGAKIVHTETKAQAPVDSGLLKSALKVRAAKRSRKRIAVNVQTKDGDYKGETFYGAFVTYGHRLGKRSASVNRSQKVLSEARRGRGTGRGGTRTVNVLLAAQGLQGDTRKAVPANNFMERAFNTKSQQAANVIEQTMKAGIEREASK